VTGCLIGRKPHIQFLAGEYAADIAPLARAETNQQAEDNRALIRLPQGFMGRILGARIMPFEQGDFPQGFPRPIAAQPVLTLPPDNGGDPAREGALATKLAPESPGLQETLLHGFLGIV
jgi:hypothetical protein